MSAQASAARGGHGSAVWWPRVAVAARVTVPSLARGHGERGSAVPREDLELSVEPLAGRQVRLVVDHQQKLRVIDVPATVTHDDVAHVVRRNVRRGEALHEVAVERLDLGVDDRRGDGGVELEPPRLGVLLVPGEEVSEDREGR